MRTCTKYLYRLQDINTQTIFGHEELLLGIPREKTMKVMEDCMVMFLNKDEFEAKIDKRDIAQLKR